MTAVTLHGCVLLQCSSWDFANAINLAPNLSTKSREIASSFEDKTPVKEEKKFSLSTQGTPKKAKSEEFDSLFEDDLPF